MPILLFFAFLSGLVTILSPCILPVLPIVLSGSIGGRRRPAGVILGFILSFSIFTLTLTSLVSLLNIPPSALRIIAVVLIVLFGLIMLIPRLSMLFEAAAARLSRKGEKKTSATGFPGGLLSGASLGIIWAPCVGPIMASVISLAVTRTVDGGAVLIILAYSIGTSIPMLAIMLGGRALIKKLPPAAMRSGRIQQLFGILMIIVGISIGFGLDQRFQTAVLKVFPGYGTGLTVFENIKPVREAIDARSASRPGTTMMSEDSTLSFDVQPENGVLGDYGQAPQIVTEGKWFNTGEQALNMDELRGKVVIVDFWTYSCINCVRTIPYLRSWHEAYEDEGLVIIGVHSPEFAFERSPVNVRKAMEELNVSWPVVLDNEFAQWKAYNNRYWPAKYFIDAEGRIRYFHFGEGDYDVSEKVIRNLLKEAGASSLKKAEKQLKDSNKSRTHELYLGYGRTTGFLSEAELKRNAEYEYESAGDPENGEWSLDGLWTFGREWILSEDSGELEMGFHAKDVFLVIEPLYEGGTIEIEIDGEPVEDTPDVRNGILRADESRLYQLVKLKKSGRHKLKLRTNGRYRLFAFTFG